MNIKYDLTDIDQQLSAIENASSILDNASAFDPQGSGAVAAEIQNINLAVDSVRLSLKELINKTGSLIENAASSIRDADELAASQFRKGST